VRAEAGTGPNGEGNGATLIETSPDGSRDDGDSQPTGGKEARLIGRAKCIARVCLSYSWLEIGIEMRKGKTGSGKNRRRWRRDRILKTIRGYLLSYRKSQIGRTKLRQKKK
jgi:hypothetical protein